MTVEKRLALAASPTKPAQEAAAELRRRYEWFPAKEADIMVALGGDGFLLQTLHAMLDRHRPLPVFGMNLGTVGFLMNNWSPDLLENRLLAAKTIKVAPLRMDAVTVEGKRETLSAINEVSLLRETRQTAWIEVSVDGRVVLPELVCDGVLVATPAGSTAYNFQPTARFSRSNRRWWRSPRSAPSARGAGAGRFFPTARASAFACSIRPNARSAPSPTSARCAMWPRSTSPSIAEIRSHCSSIPSMRSTIA
jgi:hypothetical protein